MSKRRPKLEEVDFTPKEETVLTHTSMCHGDTVDARVIIALEDKDGNEWVYNGVKKFKLKFCPKEKA